MPSSRNLTLEEIGRRAGVSRSTVSRVLNEQPDVRPEVRERVERVIAQTGYVPNEAARALVSNRRGLIGLLMLADVAELFSDPYYPALVRGIQQGCSERGVIFTMFPVAGTDGNDLIMRRIAQGLVDGVVAAAGPGPRDRLIASLRDMGSPMVVVGHPADDHGITRVDVENRAGSKAAVDHLVAHGRRRIGFVGPTAEYRFGAERLDGYRDALQAAGLDVDHRLIARHAPTVDGGRRAMTELLSAEPDAVHVATDTMAEGAYRALAEHGLEVPDDVAVVGFDGFPQATTLEPALTTVVQPVVDVGRTAVELLLDDEQAARTIVLPTALRLRRSCGAECPRPR
jgi:LacI family transcriptional regulator